MTKTAWRFVPYKVSDPALNMAIDEAILEAHLAGKVPPTLRIYGWSPAAVSIGYSQSLRDESRDRILSQGLHVVRRPTGGRAVLHESDLTYAFVGSAVGGAANQGFIATGILEGYRQICKGLLEAMLILGVELEIGASGDGYKSLEDCFAATTTADLHYRGKKMIGSAQLRRGVGVLQHGSILLDQSQNSMTSLLRNNRQEQDRHANLFDVIETRPTIEELGTALKVGFEKAFDIEIVEGVLTEHEQQLAEELLSKYKSEASFQIAGRSSKPT